VKLLLVGSADSRVCDWSGYALLRDNIQHFIEGGDPTGRFRALHEIERAVDDGYCFVDAARLRGEVLRGFYALGRVQLEQAAVSLRTRAILTESTKAPTASGTVIARQVRWKLPLDLDGSVRIADAVHGFVTAVLAITERAVDGDRLEVRRYGRAPQFSVRTLDDLRIPTAVGEPTRATAVGLTST
jgi:hypothetical protein